METIVKDWFEKWAGYSPAKMAVSEAHTGRSWDFATLNAQADAFCAFLQGAGLKAGDRLAVLSDFCLEYVALLGVTQKLGLVLVPLNYRLTGRELEYQLADSAASTLLVSEGYRSKLPDLPFVHGLGSIYMLEELPMLASGGGDYKRHVPDEQDAALILYTSGTTGFPKGCLYTHGMMFWNALNTAMRLELTCQDHTLVCMPPFHTGGWNVLLSPCLFYGASVTLLPKFDPGQVLQVLQDHRITQFMGVPTMLKMMAEEPFFAQVDLSGMRFCVVGGEHMPLPLIGRWAEKGVPIRQGFGMTEAGPNLFSLHQDDAIRKKGSIGTPNFYVEVRLVDEQGREVAPGQAGELLVRGPVVTPGYWANPQATAQALDGGWLHTGDLLRCDEEGYYYVVDRIKHMFISGGENVYPAEVEYFLRQHPGIAEAVVWGVPDERWGEVGRALLVPATGSSLSEEEVRAYCGQGLARYKVPKYIELVEALPRNDAGKIDRRALRQGTRVG